MLEDVLNLEMEFVMYTIIIIKLMDKIIMVRQQQELIIPALWGNGSKYWCADGRYVQVASSGNTVHFYTVTNPNETHVNRFIYDLWYWGDDPMEDTETYWPNKHEH